MPSTWLAVHQYWCYWTKGDNKNTELLDFILCYFIEFYEIEFYSCENNLFLVCLFPYILFDIVLFHFILFSAVLISMSFSTFTSWIPFAMIFHFYFYCFHFYSFIELSLNYKLHFHYFFYFCVFFLSTFDLTPHQNAISAFILFSLPLFFLSLYFSYLP